MTRIGSNPAPSDPAGCSNRTTWPTAGWLALASRALARPIDPAVLTYFRIAFAAVMLWQLLGYFAADHIGRVWVRPEFHFHYPGFDWVHPFPGAGMYVLCGALAVAAVSVMVGWCYRFSSACLAAGCSYLFLIEKSQYLNHGYLMCLLAWMMVLLPASACWSLDARRMPGPGRAVVPAWTLGLLRFQVAVVYVFGGIAKLNSDWFRGEPMRQWLREKGDLPVVGPLLRSDGAPWFFSYGGLLFDFLIVPALICRRTRAVGFAVAIAFHVANSCLFNIGVFPWLAILLTALFFDPAWPRRMLLKLRRWVGAPGGATIEPDPRPGVGPRRFHRWTACGLGLYAAVQVLVPLRHLLLPGNVNWTEEGHDFSWRMMLRSKRLQAAGFYVSDPASGTTWLLDPLAHLTPDQFDEMAGRPEMVRQFCAHVGALMRKRGYSEAEVRAVIHLRLNDHPPALLVDPRADLASVERSFAGATWILPLEPQLGSAGRPSHPGLAYTPAAGQFQRSVPTP